MLKVHKNKEHGIKITYKWEHIPSGKIGTRTSLFESFNTFLELLEAWNLDQPNVWAYSFINSERV